MLSVVVETIEESYVTGGFKEIVETVYVIGVQHAAGLQKNGGKLIVFVVAYCRKLYSCYVIELVTVVTAALQIVFIVI